MPDEPKKPERVRWELRLVSEFLDHAFPLDRKLIQVRIGSPPISPGVVPLNPAERDFLKNRTRWIDGLVIRPVDVILVEGEVLPSPGVISTLQLYRKLFLRDADFAEFLHLPVRMMAVWGFNDPALADIARDAGVEVRIFTPPWLPDGLRAKFPTQLRKTTATKTPPL